MSDLESLVLTVLIAALVAPLIGLVISRVAGWWR